jgi:hypothetical protein
MLPAGFSAINRFSELRVAGRPVGDLASDAFCYPRLRHNDVLRRRPATEATGGHSSRRALRVLVARAIGDHRGARLGKLGRDENDHERLMTG